jgi:D-alanyl-D-alanine carboxypeptidase
MSMMDIRIQQLLIRAINTPTKLHLLLIFHEHTGLHATAAQAAERACRDIWSVAQALYELANVGILGRYEAASEPVYYYCPRSEYIGPIQVLLRTYDNPLERTSLRRTIHDLTDSAVHYQVMSSLSEPLL